MKTKMPHAFALDLARQFVASVSNHCERIQIAGSLRRKKETVGDIEIVAIPKYLTTYTLLGEKDCTTSLLALVMRQYPRVLGKDHYQQYILCKDPTYGEISLDLFVTTPECWGVNLAIRTGSADFSHWLVTDRQKGGAKPGYLKFKDGRLWSGDNLLETPEEIDVFKALRLEWIPPEQRIEGRWRR